MSSAETHILAGKMHMTAGDMNITTGKLTSRSQEIESHSQSVKLYTNILNTVAKQITQKASIPVIGIGAGVDCDGQILVLYDILGISAGKIPKFSKNFMAEAGDIPAAVRLYVEQVKASTFPASEHSFQS